MVRPIIRGKSYVAETFKSIKAVGWKKRTDPSMRDQGFFANYRHDALKYLVVANVSCYSTP